MERIILPNNDIVDYDEKMHAYYVNGVRVPSITQLIACYFGDIYSDVPAATLEKAAAYGTAVHQELQDLLEGNAIEINSIEADNFMNYLAPKMNLEPINCEQIVVIYNSNLEPVAAGRYDLFAYTTENRIETFIDFKTTSVLHRQQVIFQLNLYKLGSMQSGYISKDIYNKCLLCVCQLKGPIKRNEYLPNLSDSTLSIMIDKAVREYYIDKELENASEDENKQEKKVKIQQMKLF